MVKKIIAVATAILMLCCMVPLAAFADDILDTCPKCGERTYETWQDFSTSVPDLGFPISIKRRHCTSCQYTYPAQGIQILPREYVELRKFYVFPQSL